MNEQNTVQYPKRDDVRPEELRIGNYIYSHSVGKSIRISGNDIYKFSNPMARSFWYGYNGILITEELLLKLGFEKTDRFFNKNYVLLLYTSGICLYHYSNLSDAKATIKYVHQLQNLYYSLTNKELSI